ncbi:efflux RND transporter periplasmic adaptor subunit [Bythopirellula polymerisocia]|uniref:Multidrug resistance protein MdtA n=1 Tax=Bythopirellula polymerisocia TaxID=2528003 RepID=A0A5C6CF05_9BACT|nr:efflux RND transporter periplasmic adaptor subunit [Bythopirellula polymerisocia]TWU22585.1 Multidrug resistance protein MdtA precursor [Bythopirellula polymerisocia]
MNQCLKQWTFCVARTMLMLIVSALPAIAQPPGGKPGQEPPPAGIVAAPVVEKSIEAEQTFVGTVMPLRVATIGSAVSGRVIECPFEEGDRVEANQPLAQLLTDTIKLEITGAEAELDLRKEQLAELENGSRPEEIAQSKARMLAAEARRDFLDARYGRMQSLRDTRGAVTEEEVEDAKSQSLEGQQVFAEMQAAYDLAIAGPREEMIAQARAQVAIQEALVEKLHDQLQKHTIISRFPGYVVSKISEAGQWVNPGDAVAEVASIDEVDVVVQVVEDYISFVRPGIEVAVEIPAIPNRQFVGKTIATIPQGDVRARTFPVKIRVANEIGTEGPLILAGMYARALLPIAKRNRVIMVPKDAVVLGGPQPIIVVIEGASALGETGSPVTVPVKLGTSQGDLIQVIGNVQPGQMVVVQGNERIRPGQKVLIGRIAGETNGGVE